MKTLVFMLQLVVATVVIASHAPQAQAAKPVPSPVQTGDRMFAATPHLAVGNLAQELEDEDQQMDDGEDSGGSDVDDGSSGGSDESTEGKDEKDDAKAGGKKEKKELAEEDIIIEDLPRGPLRDPRKIPPTPQVLEGIYQTIWSQIGKTYVDIPTLKNWAVWRDKYNGQLKTWDDLDKAIKELSASLGDRWTRYQSQADMSQAKHLADEGTVEAGIDISKDASGAWRIDFLTFGSPAQKSRLREGDVVKSLNGKDINTLSATEIETLTSGHAGDKVTVVVNYGGKDETVEIVLAKTPVDEIVADLLPGDIGYVRFPSFEAPNAHMAFMNAVLHILNTSESTPNGLIIDMRNNPGGRFNEAVDLCSMLLDNKEIVSTKTREGNIQQNNHFTVTKPPEYVFAQSNDPAMARKVSKTFQHVPIVVLTNGSTCSAAELTTGALKDNGRAKVIGTTTFGKGVGFTPIRSPNGGVLMITVMRYLTPKGTDISGKGIVPDIVVEQPRDTQEDVQLQKAIDYFLPMIQQNQKNEARARDIAVQPHDQIPAADSSNNFSVKWQVFGVPVLKVICIGACVVFFVIIFRRERAKKSKGG